MFMKGIRFVIDDQGERRAVIIDLNENEGMWEDFYDSVLAAERRDEPRESLGKVRRRIPGNVPVQIDVRRCESAANRLGAAVEDCRTKLPGRYGGIALDACAPMPDPVHGAVVVEDEPIGYSPD